MSTLRMMMMMKSFENIKDDDDEDIKDDDGEDGKNEDDDTLPRLQVPTVAFACKPLTSIIEMILLLGGGGSETPFGSCTMLRLDRIYSTSLSPSSMASHCRSDRPKFLLCVAF